MIYLYQKSLVLVSANYKRHLFEFFEMLLMHFWDQTWEHGETFDPGISTLFQAPFFSSSNGSSGRKGSSTKSPSTEVLKLLKLLQLWGRLTTDGLERHGRSHKLLEHVELRLNSISRQLLQSKPFTTIYLIALWGNSFSNQMYSFERDWKAKYNKVSECQSHKLWSRKIVFGNSFNQLPGWKKEKKGSWGNH